MSGKSRRVRATRQVCRPSNDYASSYTNSRLVKSIWLRKKVLRNDRISRSMIQKSTNRNCAGVRFENRRRPPRRPKVALGIDIREQRAEPYTTDIQNSQRETKKRAKFGSYTGEVVRLEGLLNKFSVRRSESQFLHTCCSRIQSSMSEEVINSWGATEFLPNFISALLSRIFFRVSKSVPKLGSKPRQSVTVPDLTFIWYSYKW